MAINVLETFYNPQNQEEQERIGCPLCGQSGERLVFEGRDLLFRHPGNYRLVRCEACELEYVNPRPTLDSLGTHYPSDYFGYALHEEAPAWMEPFLRSFARGISRRRLNYLEAVTGRITPQHRLVDVGCGVNRLLSYIQEQRGCTGMGVDFKPEIVSYVRDTLQMPIVEGTLETAELEAGHYDVVSMMEYLEHEADPVHVLQEARRITRPGGHLALELPHIDALPGRLFRSVWWNLDLPRHLIFPTPETLAKMLDRTGYELVSVKKFTFPLYVGMSLVQALGQNHWRKNRRLFPLVSSMLGVPFIPWQFALPEFMFAVARAK